MGDLEGVFVADTEDVKSKMGEDIHFGEVLGKHSEIYGVLEEKDLEVLSTDQEFIQQFQEIVGEVEHNPLTLED